MTPTQPDSGKHRLALGYLKQLGEHDPENEEYAQMMRQIEGAEQTNHLDRFIQVGARAGTLSCGAGTRLGDIIDLVLPSGWFLPGVPGTQLDFILAYRYIHPST